MEGRTLWPTYTRTVFEDVSRTLIIVMTYVGQFLTVLYARDAFCCLYVLFIC